jgi:hypothetical protein
MQAREVLHKLLIQTCGEMHAVRREALETLVWAGLTSQRMTVTGLGRAIGGVAREKHNIKRADRLLSNAHLQSEREAMYGVLAHRLVGSQRQPVLLVDWSDLDEWRRNQVLRVSLAVEGRALTVYEEVHGRKTAVKPKTHVQFLCRLQAVLPPGCRPIVVTDAGFKTPWFQAVEALGWCWVSRVRDRRYVKLGSESDWISVNSLHPQATATPSVLGEVRLARSQAHVCQLVIYKSKAKGRHEINRYGKRSRSQRSKKATRSAREPWILASNLPAGRKLAHRVVQIYRQRMQIEESFRDMKSARFGLALEFHRSRDPQRLAILLLILALALLVLWLIGSIAKERGLMRHYQANTVRHREVLSVIFLGIRIIERAQDHFTAAELCIAWQSIPLRNARIPHLES